MKRYKLLKQDRTTHGGMAWPVGHWNEATGDPAQGLCSDGWLHCYDSPELALFLNPVHASIENPIVCEVETAGRGLTDRGLKRGYRRMRVVRDLDVKQPTILQRVVFAILCAKQVYHDPEWNAWADRWLSGRDRSAYAAANAAAPAYAAANAAANAAAYAAANAAAANAAAYAAASAAAYAAHVGGVNLVAIARSAMKY